VQISKPNPVCNSGSDPSEQAVSAYEIVASTLQDPILILRRDLVIEWANAAFGQAFRINLNEVVGCRLNELRNGQWNILALRAAIEGVISGGAPVTN